LVEEGLSFSRFERDDFEALGTTDTEGGSEVVNGRGFGGDVEFLRRMSI
jgi:hypothetical protein